jgi:hypothetical protein
VEENERLFLQLEKTRQDFTQARERAPQPTTLRGIISMRMIETSESSIADAGPQNTSIAESEQLDPIPAEILDVALSPDQLNAVDGLLGRNREIYSGLFIRTCIFCHKPKFYASNSDIKLIFYNIVEFPLLDPYRREDSSSYGEICSLCLFKKLLRDICCNWWQNIGALVWLKPRCSRRCCVNEWITGIDSLQDYLRQFRSLGRENIRKCLNW